MKYLILIRHAKSDWSFDLPDLERPISNRGKNDIKIMSSVLKKINLNPEYIFVSKAKRTIQTFEFFRLNGLFLKQWEGIKYEDFNF